MSSPRRAGRGPGGRPVMALMARSLVVALVAVCAYSASAYAQTQVARTVHNLSATGPGRTRAQQSVGVCVFCHTPHNAEPTRALWNRDLPGTTYRLYESSTMKAVVNQPTGSSRLCLSCHDGIVALGRLRVRPGHERGASLASMPAINPAMSLGTDLSNDHPVSFTYDTALALNDDELVDPKALPRTAPLDEDHQMQCTSCHDPHEERWPDFLRIDPRFGADCTVCHRQRYWRQSSHATSPAIWRGGGLPPWPANGYSTMAENACLSCHRVHGAAHGPRLLAQPLEAQNCTICHDGSMAPQNIQAELLKPSRHPVEASQWVHDPAENPLAMPRHVTCVDCHNPHAATASTASRFGARESSVILRGPLREVSGVTISGAPIKQASFEYQICLKCHGLNEPTTPGIVRQSLTRNIRLLIKPANRSYHPIAAPGKSLRITGLLPPYTASSILTCTDCHNNDEWTPGGTAPRGPHGSRFDPILAREYQTVDPSPESYSSYALCYQCHDRGSLLFSAGGFPHKQHVVDSQTSCAVCHDAHGSVRNPYLIDFMTMAKQGNTVVRPSSSGRLEFDPGQPGHGKCYLTCHGEDHNPRSY
jgi:predicted CXXCH cytochrome family protein